METLYTSQKCNKSVLVLHDGQKARDGLTTYYPLLTEVIGNGLTLEA